MSLFLKIAAGVVLGFFCLWLVSVVLRRLERHRHPASTLPSWPWLVLPVIGVYVFVGLAGGWKATFLPLTILWACVGAAYLIDYLSWWSTEALSSDEADEKRKAVWIKCAFRFFGYGAICSIPLFVLFLNLLGNSFHYETWEVDLQATHALGLAIAAAVLPGGLAAWWKFRLLAKAKPSPRPAPSIHSLD